MSFTFKKSVVATALALCAAGSHAQAGGPIKEGWLGVGAGPEFAGVEVFQDGREATGVVFVRVRGHYNVEAADMPGPEVGGDYVFAAVEIRASFATVLEEASAIDQHGCALGEDDQKGVALAYVYGG